MSDAITAREGERRREDAPHYIGDVVVRYNRLYGADEDKAAVIITIPHHADLVIGPLRSTIAKEVFDSMRQPAPQSIAQLEIKVGDRVRVRGDHNDGTYHVDGKVGVVIEVYDDYLVRFDCGSVLRIWSHNIVEVLR